MSTKAKSKPKRNPAHYSPKDLKEYIVEESERTGRSKDEILEDTFHDGYVVVSESADGQFKVEGGQLFKTISEKTDDLTECRRLRERFGPIGACIDYIKDVIMGSGFDVMVDDIHDEHQQKVKEEILKWMKIIYQDVYTVGLNSLLNILVDNALTDGFAAAEIVYTKETEDFFMKYAKPITSSVMSQEGGKLAKSDYTSYEIREPQWSELGGIARLKIFLDAPTRLRLMRRGRTWEADYWVLDQPNVAGAQGGMQSATQKNLQQGTPMQLTSDDLVRSTLPNKTNSSLVKPSAYFLPWQIFSLAVIRRTWLEKGPSIILPALKTAQLLEKIMNAVGEGIYRAGNKKYFIICGTKDRPWGGIHIRNLLSQIKDASEKNWSTIPVPAGFDLKEAGGTVFEAQNAINYFLRIIAGIMHVSPSVLGLDAREAVKGIPDFTHLRLKEEFRSQIQTQLVRLHIWATYGQQKQKQGGYNEPQWIPELRVKTEDLLNPADRLKLDIDILNAANPVMPQTKLEVERDIVKTRGWEVDLPTQQDYMKELKKKQDEDEAFKKQQRELQLQNAKESKAIESKDKTMGSPSPPSQEKQQKRLEGGVSTRKTDTGATSNPPRGNTRIPREARRQIQESLANVNVPETLKGGDTFVVSNPFSGVTRDASKNEFAGITIEVKELNDAIAGYNRDLTKIYMDPLIPVEYYKPIIAHEIFQYILEFKMGVAYKKSEEMATELEDSLCAELGINPNVYERKCKEVMAQVSKRIGVENPIDIVKHKEEIQETKQEKSQKVELTIKTEPIKVEQLKTEKQDKLEITLKDDPDKKKANEEIHEKKKKILDRLNEQISKEGEN